MIAGTSGGPATRVLHVCYCCNSAEAAAELLVDGLGMQALVQAPVQRTNGAILGLEEMECRIWFLFDERGARVSPGIEIQEWVDPPLVGGQFPEPHHIGLQALGFTVPSIDATLPKIDALGGKTVGRTESSTFGGPAATVRDRNGVTIDLVEDRERGEDGTRFRHLRLTCSDQARSAAWYRRLGFSEVAAPRPTTDGALFGLTRDIDASVARLRLADEPFEVVLMEWSDPRPFGAHHDRPNHGGLYRAALRVDDTRASHASMSAEGWSFDRGPLLVPLPETPIPDLWIAFASDPDGIPMELVERPRSAFR